MNPIVELGREITDPEPPIRLARVNRNVLGCLYEMSRIKVGENPRDPFVLVPGPGAIFEAFRTSQSPLTPIAGTIVVCHRVQGGWVFQV